MSSLQAIIFDKNQNQDWWGNFLMYAETYINEYRPYKFELVEVKEDFKGEFKVYDKESILREDIDNIEMPTIANFKKGNKLIIIETDEIFSMSIGDKCFKEFPDNIEIQFYICNRDVNEKVKTCSLINLLKDPIDLNTSKEVNEMISSTKEQFKEKLIVMEERADSLSSVLEKEEVIDHISYEELVELDIISSKVFFHLYNKSLELNGEETVPEENIENSLRSVYRFGSLISKRWSILYNPIYMAFPEPILHEIETQSGSIEKYKLLGITKLTEGRTVAYGMTIEEPENIEDTEVIFIEFYIADPEYFQQQSEELRLIYNMVNVTNKTLNDYIEARELKSKFNEVEEHAVPALLKALFGIESYRELFAIENNRNKYTMKEYCYSRIVATNDEDNLTDEITEHSLIEACEILFQEDDLTNVITEQYGVIYCFKGYCITKDNKIIIDAYEIKSNKEVIMELDYLEIFK